MFRRDPVSAALRGHVPRRLRRTLARRAKGGTPRERLESAEFLAGSIAVDDRASGADIAAERLREALGR